MIRSRVMSKSLTMFEIVGGQILEKSKDLIHSQNSKHSWLEVSICCNWEVRSVAFPLIEENHPRKWSFAGALGLRHEKPHPVVSEKTTWIFLSPFLWPTV